MTLRIALKKISTELNINGKAQRAHSIKILDDISRFISVLSAYPRAKFPNGQVELENVVNNDILG